MFGFYRIAAAIPRVQVADPAFNLARHIELARKADAEGASFLLFPELSITGYTCGDLFHQELLLTRASECVASLARDFADSPLVIAVGFPLRVRNSLYNCAAILQRGRVLGVVPKTVIPNQREFYEKRHFSSGANVPDAVLPDLPGSPLFSGQRVFEFPGGVRLGIELCEDLWSPLPPSQFLAVNGANLILNLSASNALVSKTDYRRQLVLGQSARCMAVYAYTSAGVGESTTDTVYSGHAILAENGSLLAESEPFARDSSLIYADADLEKTTMLRACEGSFQNASDAHTLPCVRVGEAPRGVDSLCHRFINAHPFVPGDAAKRDAVCREIFSIQSAGLAKRIEHSHAKTAVLGISGGLDSTLALIVTAEAFRMLSMPPERVIALTMPGFGTTDRTLRNACTLSRLLGCTLREIDIRKACLRHFEDIGHDPAVLDVTYENTQARERTQILMDTANREGGLVVGTGDLSEIALGWSTYNADHMSMYAVNCGVPKTLVRHLTAWCADRGTPDVAAVLRDIIDTPVSPELLPAGKDGKIQQKTESILGSYELHDFYLYHFLKYGASPDKIRFLAASAFAGKYPPAELDRTLKLFLRRFFTQQFKRSCIPDGPKVGTVALSPRADWRMPSDASAALWLE